MRLFVAGNQTAQNGDGVFRSGLLKAHQLKSSGKGRVLFKVFFILAPGGGGHGPQLAPRQRRFEQVCAVAAARGIAGAYQGVRFVDKQNGGHGRRLDFVNDALETFFKFSLDGGPGLKASHIQTDKAGSLQRVRHVAPDDLQRQPLDDGGLAHAGIADKNGIVLAAARQNVDHLADLRAAGKNGINATLPGFFRKVCGVALQAAFLARRGGRGAALLPGEGFIQASHEAFQRVGGNLAQLPENRHGAVAGWIGQQRQNQRENVDPALAELQTGQQVGFLKKLDQQRRKDRGRASGSADGRTPDQMAAHGLVRQAELGGEGLHFARVQQLCQIVFYAYFVPAAADAEVGGVFQRVAAGRVESGY